MDEFVIEQKYPLSFREEDTKILAEHIRNRQSTVLIGMKRVGIANFLRFFLNHKQIPKQFIDSSRHLFIPIDLNDLVERELYPFWMLVMKRLLDSVEKSELNPKIKKQIEILFLDSIQSKDLFLLIDSIRRSLVAIIAEGFLPTLFFLRFDRIKEALSPEFFANLQGLHEATSRKLSFVFTSFRNLNFIAPQVFPKTDLSVFVKNIYFKPANHKDLEIIYQTYKESSGLKLSTKLEEELFNTADGYIQYLQLALIYLKENLAKEGQLFESFIQDERITLQSEELWESLSTEEKEILTKIMNNQEVTDTQKEQARYLWDTGMISNKGKKVKTFSPLFDHFVESKINNKLTTDPSADFSI